MERLTTNEPKSNIENLLNLAYAEDKWVKIRGMDKPFTDYIKKGCRRHGCNLSDMSDYEVCEYVAECAFSNPECPVFLLYSVATQAAELRARLADYEDAEEQGLLVRLSCEDCSGITYRQTNSGKIIPADKRCAAKITPPCYQPDGDGCAYQTNGDGGEPIDKCKECPLCYTDKVRHKHNAPLTLEELRGMDGEPVYIVDMEPLELGWKNRWFLVDADEDVVYNDGYQFEIPQCVGFAYRCKPEQEVTHV